MRLKTKLKNKNNAEYKMKNNTLLSAFLKLSASVILFNQIVHADAVFDPATQPIVSIAPCIEKY